MLLPDIITWKMGLLLLNYAWLSIYFSETPTTYLPPEGKTKQNFYPNMAEVEGDEFDRPIEE